MRLLVFCSSALVILSWLNAELKIVVASHKWWAYSFAEAFFSLSLSMNSSGLLAREMWCKWKWNECDNVHSKQNKTKWIKQKRMRYETVHTHIHGKRERKRSKAMLLWSVTMIPMIYFWIWFSTWKNILYFSLLNRLKTKTKKLQQKFNGQIN